MTRVITTYDGRTLPAGRKHGLDARFVEVLVMALEKGVPLTKACAIAGRTHSTVFRWLMGVEELGHEPEDCEETPVWLNGVNQQDYCPRFCGLYRAIKEAQARWTMKQLDKIESAPEWQSAAWSLERGDPANFAKTERIHMTGDGKDPLSQRLEPGQLEAMAQGALATIGAAAVVAKLMGRGEAEPSVLPPAESGSTAQVEEAELVAPPPPSD